MKEVFQIGNPVHGDLFAGRKELIEELANSLGSREITQNFAMIGYRRIGKSSVMRVVKDELDKDKNMIVVYLDVQQIIPFNIDEFFRVYASSLLEAYCRKKGNSALGLKAKNFIRNGIGELKEIISGFHGQVKDFFVFWFEKSEKKSLSNYTKECFGLSDLLAAEKEKFVIMIDEFQDLEALGIDFEKSFRSNIQQMKKTVFLISGSKASMMRNMMYSESSPFYNLFIVKYLEELKPSEAKAFLGKRFSKAGVKISEEAISEIIRLTNSHPYHLQWLGRACLFKAASSEIAAKNEVEEAFNWAITEEAGHLEYAYNRLARKDKAIVTACAKLGASEPIEIARELREESDRVRPFMPNLVEDGYLIKEDSKYRIRDPVLEAYIKRKIIQN